MKKLFLSTIALAMVFVFTSCKDDVTPPEITLPTDASVPVFQLGDKTAALNGVTAKDKKDGDVTSNLGVEGLEYVDSAATLIYSVSDEAANMAVATRTATISAEKLFGSYTISEMDDDLGGDPEVYNVTVAESASGKSTLVINNLYDANWTVVLKGNKGAATLEANPLGIELGGERGTLTGTATYSNNGTYAILTFKYQIAFTGKESMHYTATFTKK